MIILDSTLKSLEIKLAGSVATTELPFVASAVTITTDTLTFVSAENDGTTNGTTAVTAIAAPGASATQKQVKFLSVYNVDTASATVTVQLNNNGTKRVIFTATLAVGYTLQYTDGEGFRVLNTSGAVLMTGLSSGIAFLSATTTLNNAQIKALFHSPSTPVQLLDAPAAGYRNRILAVSFSTHIEVAGQYTNIDATYADIHIGIGGSYTVYGPVDDPGVAPALTTLTQILGTSGADTVYDPLAPNQIAVGAGNLYVQTIAVEGTGTLSGAAVNIYGENNGSGDLTGGDALNTMKVTVYYAVEAL